MEQFVLSAATGALAGLCIGLLINGLDAWRKDRRDAKLRKQGIPVPSDRVAGKYHWLFLIIGLLYGIMVSW